ncbi:MAG: flagellar assembly peptidoglycan hydrolase FlgJ [Methylophaga sp.]|nr:flagellar assembly peptidoglycan hydrolase FlgJ [Methylophaga sp.]
MALDQINHTSVDFHGLNQLRESAAKADQSDQTLRQVAAQFESIFVSLMLKSMRQVELSEGIFDSEQSKMYRDMADQQLAMDMSGSGGLGLQDMIIRQLGGNPAAADMPVGGQTFMADTIQTMPRLVEYIRELKPDAADETVATDTPAAVTKSEQAQLERPLPARFNSPAEFVERLWPMAEKAASKIGAAPEAIMAQAALETGWGKHILQDPSGSSFNLFNIKADSRWSGDYTSKNVLEYQNGQPIQEQSRFRNYADYQQSFDDYVDFLQSNPRYQNALQQAGNPERFVEQLHKAGYATDPQYASKLKRIMQGETLAQNANDF